MKKGVSTVIATLLLIVLTISLVGILWGVVKPLVDDRLDESKTCLNLMDKVSLDYQYTCYNVTGDGLLISINVGDVDLDKLIVAVSSLGQSKTFELTKYGSNIPNVKYYNETLQVRLPQKNTGITYIYNTTTAGSGYPDSVKIAPVVKGKKCGDSGVVSEVESC